ncbi:hypothetical protein JHD50_09275 [Sulfurimonas sp. MAG313]|nr:hypothetical protein [Sulfurimonas sp. MAG313]MDF1881489.1 hypothetical protein [Sulfurimonas sp. MAG313]
MKKLIYKEHNLEIFKVCSDVEPYWLYLDGIFRGSFFMLGDHYAKFFVDNLIDYTHQSVIFKNTIRDQVKISFSLMCTK